MKHITPMQTNLLLAGMLAAAQLSWPLQAACSTATEVQSGALEARGPTVTVSLDTVTGDQPVSQAAAPAATPPAAQDPPLLTLADALRRAQTSHPGLAALDREFWALDSIAWQAGRRPNPGLELELEEFGGTQDALGVRALSTTLTYTQPVERGGKREKRETAASLERELVLWDIAEVEYGIQAAVRTAYGAAQAAQYELAELRRYRALVQRIHDTVTVSVEAGRSARLELERFEIELARLELELAGAERVLDQSLLELAGTWGALAVDFPAVEAAGPAVASVPPLELLQPLLADHPALARFDAEYEVLCALLDLEHANAVGDLELSGGVSRLNEINETVFKVGLAWDLTSNDRNEGNIGAAAQRLEQVEERRALVRRELETELAALHRLASGAHANYSAYGASLLPAANEALALTEEGYRFGKFDLLEVLDAQRTVLELEREQTAALNELNAGLTGIEALLNTSLAGLPGESSTAAQPPAKAPDAKSTETAEEHDHE